MTLPQFTTGHTVTANDWNAHVDAINANTSSSNEAHLPSLASDFVLYGDAISNNTRTNSWYGEPAGNGFLTIAATIAPRDLTASEFRFAVLSAHTGSSEFHIGVYHGLDLTNLSQVTSHSGTTLVSSTGVVSLSASLNVTQGDSLAIALLQIGASTPPTFAMTAAGGTTRNIIASGNVYATYLSGQSSLPSTINTNTSGTAANKQTWFALA